MRTYQTFSLICSKRLFSFRILQKKSQHFVSDWRLVYVLRSAARDAECEQEQQPVRPRPALHEHRGRGGSWGRAYLSEPSVRTRGVDGAGMAEYFVMNKSNFMDL